MGYSIRTATHRYTRWVEWPSWKTTAEELYDYTAPGSAVPRWTTFVERRNLIYGPAYRVLGAELRARMDDVLADRLIVAPERTPPGEGQGVAKKKRKRAG